MPLQTKGTLLDRDHNSFRQSPIYGDDYPARAVLIENQIDQPVPVQVVDGEPGTPFLVPSEAATTPGLQQTLVSYTVPALTVLDLYKVSVVSRVHGKFRVNLDGSLIGSGRTGPSISELSKFDWSPRLTATAGQIVEILFTSMTGTPISEVEAYLHGASRPSS